MKEQTMNIKPSKDQMREWHDAAVMSATPGSLAFTWTVAELAAQWGAAQAQQTTVDAARVLEWMRTPDRKPANLAFTDGPERQAAYWIEIAQQTTEEPELPEAVAYRQWNGDEGYWYYGDASCAEKNDELLYTAAQMHEHYAAGVRAGAAGNQWQPIASAPKDGTKVLAYTNDGYKYPLVCQCVWGDGAWWPDVWESPEEPLSPTHWMPLPAAPEEQKQ